MAIFNSYVSSPEGISLVTVTYNPLTGIHCQEIDIEWKLLFQSPFWLGLPSGELSHNNGQSPFIVDFPIKNGGSFHCYGTVHQVG